MDKQATLHDKYATTGEMIGGFGETPPYITANIAHALRPYQTEAVGRFLFYMDRDQQNKRLPVQLLFNMATGSGKTLVMAALMLDLYRRGRRNFVFFVNSTTIIDKTRANFLYSSAPKYLFTDRMMINGQPVQLREVSNFGEAQDDAINIVFTTIQGLHLDLNNPRENRLTYDELAEYDVVLLSDEAHHLNAATKRSKTDEKDNASWEQTIDNIMALNPQNILLEFTATVDTGDASIGQKYNQRILYQYDLKAFRQDGFSKDVLIYEVDSDLMDRALQAIIISQYRKKVALEGGVWCKPVVMFKSATKAASSEFYEQFKDKISNLSTEDIERQKPKAASILSDAFAYFEAQEISSADLIAELRTDFAAERLILIDSDNKAAEKQLQLNTLEERTNEIRAVFSVDMLDEGWDVLNLFDIVRLYDKRDSKNGKPGKTTLREAQLIGRGARYFPFSISGEDKFTRKYDENELEPLRAIEQLHYHSAHNPEYIREITRALKDSGIVPDEAVERTLRLKDNFLTTQTYAHGQVWRNRQLTREEAVKAEQIRLIEDKYDIPSEVQVELPSHIGQVISVFGDEDGQGDSVVNERATRRIKLGDLPKSLVRTAVNRNKKFSFDKIQTAFIGVQSMQDFMFSKTLLGGIDIVVSGEREALYHMDADQKLIVAGEVLRVIEQQIDMSEQAYVGSQDFEPVAIKDAFQKIVKRKFVTSESSDKETGYPQYASTSYALNLADRDWYVYDENYGTSEEKSLVVLLDGMMDDLRKKWSDIYLLRNEKAVRIYDFDEGRAFEPDYLLVANDKNRGNVSWQVFIEPKGDQFIASDGTFESGKEGWKQRFLAQIEAKFDAVTLAESKKYKVVGIPFYNEHHTQAETAAELKELGLK